MTVIGTSTSANATRQPGQRKILVAPSDGRIIAIYHDGSNLVFRSAASPYTSWSSTTTIDTGQPEADALIVSDDTVHVLYKSSDNSRLYIRALTRSSSTWTVGSANDVFGSASDFGGNGDVPLLAIDGSGRLWAVYYRYNGSSEFWEAYYSEDDGATWTQSLTGGAVQSGARFNRAVAVSGDWLVVAYADDDALKWRRLDVTGTLTAWSSQQSYAGNNLWSSANLSMATESGGGIVAAWQDDGGSRQGITVAVYTPGSDSWGSTADISGSTSDKRPAATVQDGEVVVAWQDYAASNSWAVVYKKRSGGSWGSQVELEPSGANNINISLGASNTVLAALWTSGTGSPYDVTVVVEATTAATLSAQGIATGAPALGAPALGQAHALAATGIAASAPTLGGPALGQVHSLAATNTAAGTPVLGLPAVGQAHILTAQGVTTGAPALGSPAIGQAGQLVPLSIAAGAPSLGTPSLGQVHSITATGIAAGAPMLASPTLAQAHALSATGVLAGAPSLGAPSLVAVAGAVFTRRITLPGRATALALAGRPASLTLRARAVALSLPDEVYA